MKSLHWSCRMRKRKFPMIMIQVASPHFLSAPSTRRTPLLWIFARLWKLLWKPPGRSRTTICPIRISTTSSCVELAKYRKQHKNNQQAGSLITRLPAFFYACKCHFSRGCSNEPPLNTPGENKVKLYQVQCSNIEEKIQKVDYKRSDSSVTIGLDGFDLLYCRNMIKNGYANLPI